LEIEAMKRFKTHLISIAAVTLWAVFSCAYLGVEDGSSGLSILGWVHAVFFVSGGKLFQVVKGAHSNQNLPVMAVLSWLFYSILVLSVVQGVTLIQQRSKRKNDQP
jgi:hypothetical protein